LSYGVSSSVTFPSKGTDGRFTVNAITNPDNIDAVEAAVMEELQRFLVDGPTEKEVADAQNAWLEQQKVSRSIDVSIASLIGNNLELDRTFEFTSKREKRVAELTPSAIHAAFKKHVDPKKLVIIRAGDFK
jgi:zinc protease